MVSLCWGVCKESRWRHCIPRSATVTSARAPSYTLEQQDGGYALLWKHYDNNNMAVTLYCCCCRCILHLQQYSRRLNLFLFFFIVMKINIDILFTFVVWKEMPCQRWQFRSFCYRKPILHSGTETRIRNMGEVDLLVRKWTTTDPCGSMLWNVAVNIYGYIVIVWEIQWRLYICNWSVLRG